MKMRRVSTSFAGLLGLFALLAAIPQLQAQGRAEEKRISPNANQPPKVDQLPKSDLQKTLPAEILVSVVLEGSYQYGYGGRYSLNGKQEDCNAAKCMLEGKFKSGSKIFVSFVPNKFTKFEYWIAPDGHPCKGHKGTTCSFTVSAESGAQKLTAFTKRPQLDVVINYPPKSYGKVNYYQTKTGIIHDFNRTVDANPYKFSWEAGRPLIIEYLPSKESEHKEWLGNCAGQKGNVCKTEPSQSPYFIGALEKTREYKVDISVVGVSDGTVYSDPPGIQCTKKGGTCSVTKPFGTFIDLYLSSLTTVKGLFISKFCEGQGNPNRCRFQVGDNISMTIAFEPK